MSRLVWCCVLLVASTGCWQEVHYHPDKPLAITPVTNDSPRDTSAAEAAVSREENPPTDELNTELAEVTADELFGTPDEAIPTADVTSGTGSADVLEPSPSEEGVFDSQEPAKSPSDLIVEQPSIPEPDSVETSVVSDDPLPAETATDAETSFGATEVLRPSRTALAVWRMSSRWSFAAAIYAKGQPEDRYRDSLEQATYAAELIGIELPAFPVSEGMALEATVIGFLLGAGPAAFVNKLNEDFVPEYEALVELAIRTNALLLVYTPKSEQLDPLILSIRQSAESSGLPAELWTELVSMLERREPFAAVKQQVLSFHTQVGHYLAGEE